MGLNDTQNTSGDQNNGTKNFVWTNKLDDCLIKVLVVQANEGMKIDKGFKDSAYAEVVRTLTSQYGHIFTHQLSISHVKNRLRTLKKRFRIIQEMMASNGFTLNPITKEVECDDQVWRTYVKAHPEARGLHGKSIDNYEDLSIVCGKDQGSGRRGTKARHIKRRKVPQIELDPEHVESPTGSMGVEGGIEGINMSPQMQQQMNQHIFTFGRHPDLNGGGSSSSRRNKKQTGQSEVDMCSMAIAAFAESLGRVASAIENLSKSTAEDSTLFQAVKEVPGLTVEEISTAYEYLITNPVKARMFMGYDSEFRSNFLTRHLGGVREDE